MSSVEFGLPVYPSVGRQAACVRDVSLLQPYIDHAISVLGADFDRVCALDEVVGVFRGWQWRSAAADCPAGVLRFSGSPDNLPPCATLDPASATTAVLAPPVVESELPVQQQAWACRPLSAALFDALSVHGCDRAFLMGVVPHGVLLVPDMGAVAPYQLSNYSSALEATGVISGMADEVAQGWVIPVSSPPLFVHPLGAVPV
jgi:hypothetical protein